MNELIIYVRVPLWVRDYGSGGIGDQRAVQDFMECETGESVRALQAELIGIGNGRYSQDQLDKTVGIKRREKHGSYDSWAKAMLVWISSYKQ